MDERKQASTTSSGLPSEPQAEHAVADASWSGSRPARAALEPGSAERP